MQPVRIQGGRAGQILPQMLPEIGQCYEAGQRILLLVPEQYTLQAERELVDGLDLPGLLDLDVLSPRRLTRLIREHGGHDGLEPLDDRGRGMALTCALNQTREELTYYRRVAATPGLPDKLSSLLGDLQRAGLTPASLHEHADSLPAGAARAKETDLALIWAAYEQVIEGRFADSAMQQRALIRRLRPSGVFDGAQVWVYGFDVLPLPLCELLAEAATLAERITVTLTMDAKEAADGRVFLTQRRSAQELIGCLETRNIPWELRYLPFIDLGRAPALQHLETHLFTRREAPFEGDVTPVSVHAAANPYAEALYGARRLRAWHDAGIPWQRMAVALASPGGLDSILAMTLRAAGIPHYLARKDSALRHGLCRMLLGALRSATGGYARQDVLTMAKSGFSPLTDGEAAQLENYALENGIGRGKWLKPFTRGPQAQDIEPLRQRLIAPVEALHDRLAAARDASASVEAVFRLLEDVRAYERLMQREEALLARGMDAEAAQNRQVWQLIMGLLDQLHALLGTTRANLRDMARFVEAGLTGAVISALPPQPDTVMVGEAGHLMTGRIDALLVMGMQDGAMASSLDSLISEQERAALSEATHRAIGLTRHEQAALRQSDFYRTFALPTQRLTVTFSEASQDGTALRPAGLISDMKALLPGLTVTGGVTADESGDAPLSPMTALDGLAMRLRQMADGLRAELEPDWQSAMKWLWDSPEWHSRMAQIIASLNPTTDRGTLPPAQVRRLFGGEEFSISRLEKFAACPYQHFVDHGLRPVKRREFAFEADERGNFFHAALQQYASLAAANPDWPNIPEAETNRMMDEVLAPLTRAWEGGPLTEDAMGRQLGETYARTIRRAAWLFTRHAQNSHFTTWGTEIVFGEEGGLPPVILTLHDGHRVALRGKIDRIDRWEGDKGLYLRVVDYKSSHRDINATRLWYGLQLQLMLYLQAASQAVEGANPAGAFYFTVQDPLVQSEEDVREKAEELIAKELRLKGVVLAEAEVVDAMDVDIPGFSIGKVFNRDGTVGKQAPAYALDEMHALLGHAKKTAADLADAIRDGQIAVSPAAIGEKWSACAWCDYRAVCGIDPSLPGHQKRPLEEIDREELIQRLKE